MIESGLEEILRNPLAVLIYLPFLPFLIVASLLARSPPLPIASQTTNLEEWVVKEDPETGEIRVTVHRTVRRV